MKNKGKVELVDRTGEVFVSKDGDRATIIEYIGAINCTIEFEDGTILKNRIISNLQKGSFKNPNKPSIYGVGFIGRGLYKPVIKHHHKLYDFWIRMLERCYHLEYHKIQPSYIGCIVAEEWHNFQNFAQWADNNYKPDYMKGWHLDKDIICKDCKIYSPETCAFVPRGVNNLFTKRESSRGECSIGVYKRGKKYASGYTKNSQSHNIGVFNTNEEAFNAYKISKEEHIKEVADKWKDLIDPRVYEAMYNYKVKIDD